MGAPGPTECSAVCATAADADSTMEDAACICRVAVLLPGVGLLFLVLEAATTAAVAALLLLLVPLMPPKLSSAAALLLLLSSTQLHHPMSAIGGLAWWRAAAANCCIRCERNSTACLPITWDAPALALISSCYSSCSNCYYSYSSCCSCCQLLILDTYRYYPSIPV